MARSEHGTRTHKNTHQHQLDVCVYLQVCVCMCGRLLSSLTHTLFILRVYTRLVKTVWCSVCHGAGGVQPWIHFKGPWCQNPHPTLMSACEGSITIRSEVFIQHCPKEGGVCPEKEDLYFLLFQNHKFKYFRFSYKRSYLEPVLEF